VGAGVSLFYNNSKTFETVSGGATVTGTFSCSNTITSPLVESTTLRTTNITAYNNVEVDGGLYADGGAQFGPRDVFRGNAGQATIDALGFGTFAGLDVAGVSTFSNVTVSAGGSFVGSGIGLTGTVDVADGTYGGSTVSPQITVADGRITGITATLISGEGGGGSGTGYFDNNQTNAGIHTTAAHVGLGTTNPITSVQVNDVYGIETGSGTFTASAGVAYTANTYGRNDFVTAEYTLYFSHSSGIQSQKVLVMDDGTTAYAQEYGIMSSNDLLVSVGATVRSGNVELEWTPETGISGTITYRYTRETMI
jgi:hypothetical protein